jgi:hypothetical protein
MKSVLLIICALGYGFLPGIAHFQYETLFTLFVPILLGLIYFVLHQYDWPAHLVPWLFVCLAIGRITGYWWFNSRHGHVGPVVDAEVWVFGALAALCFASVWWRWTKGETQAPKDVNPQ